MTYKELYKIDKNLEQENYQRHYYDQQVAELGVKVVAVGLFLLYLLLEKVLDGVNVNIPFPKKDTVQNKKKAGN
jgi:hypothetical protein